MSRVAKVPVTLAKGVEATVAAGEITVKGPLGTLKQALKAMPQPPDEAWLRALLQHPDVQAGRLDTGLVERELVHERERPPGIGADRVGPVLPGEHLPAQAQAVPELQLDYDRKSVTLVLTLHNLGALSTEVELRAMAYRAALHTFLACCAGFCGPRDMRHRSPTPPARQNSGMIRFCFA